MANFIVFVVVVVVVVFRGRGEFEFFIAVKMVTFYFIVRFYPSIQMLFRALKLSIAQSVTHATPRTLGGHVLLDTRNK